MDLDPVCTPKSLCLSLEACLIERCTFVCSKFTCPAFMEANNKVTDQTAHVRRVYVYLLFSRKKKGVSNDDVQIDLILSGQAMSKRHLFH